MTTGRSTARAVAAFLGRALVASLVLLLLPSVAWAHKTSDSYLRMRIDGSRIDGTWSLALHDLEFAIGLDANGDEAITWGELKGRREGVVEYARSRLDLDPDDETATILFDPELQVEALANGTYAVLRFSVASPRPPSSLTVDYRAFFDDNPLHRGMLLIEQGGQSRTAICSPTEPRLRFEFARPEPWSEFARFVIEGTWHIWIGYDHILFLVALLLPSVLKRRPEGWAPVDDLRGAFVNVVKVVTAFTVAHSVTLSLAAMEWVRVPSRVVETIIAGSIVVAAMNNVRPVVTRQAWGIAFGFGLIHGFGFASVLQDLGLHRASLLRALIGFNVGVELGQLAIVALFLPLAHAARGTGFYRGPVLVGGSALVAALAAWWMVERMVG